MPLLLRPWRIVVLRVAYGWARPKCSKRSKGAKMKRIVVVLACVVGLFIAVLLVPYVSALEALNK